MSSKTGDSSTKKQGGLQETLERHVTNKEAYTDLQERLGKWMRNVAAANRINTNIKNLFVKNKKLSPQMIRRAYHGKIEPHVII